MKKYKTSEVIAMLEQNPKLKFKCITDGIGEYCTIEVNHGRICWGGDNRLPMYIVVDKPLEWELVQQPVSFMEAVKAYSEGKTIRCEKNGHVLEYKPFYGMLKLKTGQAVTATQILEGRWYVEDNHE